MIIGLTGTLASGKETVVDFLVEKGFKHYSVKYFLIEEIKKRGLPINRDSMVAVANQLREINSPGYIVEKIYERAKTAGGDCIIESIRTAGEVEALKEKEDFYLIAIDADIGKRYERFLLKSGQNKGMTFLEFLENEKREMFSEDPNQQNIEKCISMADFLILNNGTIDELKEQLGRIFFKINKTEKRKDYISWDEYFMGVAILSAQRSKDPLTQTGACIINKENKIVGVGYNGFPLGCSDEDLPWLSEGKFLETKHAYVCHAELNAILNSREKLNDCKIYVNLFPCNECAKAIIQSGIKKIVYLSDKYTETDSVRAAKKMLDLSGVKYEQMIPPRDKIFLSFE